MTDKSEPAFPGSQTPPHPHEAQGITLRDWFAGQALSAMDIHQTPDKAMAKEAYGVADAMLAEREKSQ